MLILSSCCNILLPLVPVLVNVTQVTQLQNVTMPPNSPTPFPLLFTSNQSPDFFSNMSPFLYIHFTALVSVSLTPHSLPSLFQIDINNKAYLVMSLNSSTDFSWQKVNYSWVYLICLVLCLTYYIKYFWYLGSQHPFSL